VSDQRNLLDLLGAELAKRKQSGYAVDASLA